ncbi:uncharacterized protein L203_100918 [Cryptococcus depauperatus CBS 7841]|uniref:Small ribosomal subunit protein uS7 domain-containing protein n=1 Tax=Cryptococcus depauperatus CBS 7841 TaxID=1295531 RepID=A0AAJ8JNZ0_9TREE
MPIKILVATRRFATSVTRLQASPAPAATPALGFPALQNILHPSSSGSAFTQQSQAPQSLEAQEPTRGYSPDKIPPKIDPTLDLLTNCLMKHGKKTEAQKMVQSVLDLIQQTTNLAPQPLLRQSIILASPSVKILSMRKSAKTILTPRALTERQRTRQGIAWILRAAEKGRKGGIPRDQRIAREILAVLEGQSDVFKWVEEVHKTGYLNRSNMNVR